MKFQIGTLGVLMLHVTSSLTFITRVVLHHMNLAHELIL